MIKRAVKLAKAKSRHKYHRHVAFIVDGKRTVSEGWNHEEIHAETAALRNAQYVDVRGMEVVSIRWTNGDRIGMAKPCKTCMAKIVNAGIRWITYSDSTGKLIRMRV